MNKDIVLYQGKGGEIAFKGDVSGKTLWASLQQIADLFETHKSGISRHIKNVYSSGELEPHATVAKFATVQTEGDREVTREIDYYNLDLILSVGYRVNSKTATKFRQWATRTLHEHVVRGYTLNKKRISKNYKEFLQAVETTKSLINTADPYIFKANDALELVTLFANTWLSIDSYDKTNLPKSGFTTRDLHVTADDLREALNKLKETLFKQGVASSLFAQERQKESIESIIGNVYQSVSGKDVYATVEEKAAHLLYFFVKNHPFVDGNKRSGAFVFIWFLNQCEVLPQDKITPEALAALTLLVAESSPKDKERIIGLILQLLR